MKAVSLLLRRSAPLLVSLALVFTSVQTNASCATWLFGGEVRLDPKVTMIGRHRLGVQIVDPTGGGAWINRVFDVLRRVVGVEALNLAYQRLRKTYTPDQEIFAAWVEALQVKIRFTDEDLAKIPKTGPLMVMSNHPLSGVDGLAVAAMMSKVRPDVKIILTSHLSGIPGIEDVSIFVDVAKQGNSFRVFRETHEWVSEGHAVLIFPSGEVSHRQSDRRVADGRWRTGGARMAKADNVPILPIFVGGKPTERYLSAFDIHHTLGAAMVLREVGELKGKTIELRVGEILTSEQVAANTAEDLTAVARARTYGLERP